MAEVPRPSPPGDEPLSDRSNRPQLSGMRSPSVRVRRRAATTTTIPSSFPEDSNPYDQGANSKEGQVTGSAKVNGDEADSAIPLVNNSGSGAVRTRRRGYTLTDRLFAVDGALPSLSEEGDNGKVRRDSSSSRQSATVRPLPAVQIGIGNRRRRLTTSSGRSSERATDGFGNTFRGSLEEEMHQDNEVDVLEVLDQAVATTAHLSNIQRAFLPPFLSGSQPIIELEAPAEKEEEQSTSTSSLSNDQGKEEEETEEEDPLDAHLAKLLKKQKRKETMRQVLRGITAFLKTPVGWFFAAYGILVVFWGAALVLILVGAVPMSSYNKKLWVEIASQILTGLFCITSLLPLPWRLLDAFYIYTIWHFARVTYKRRSRRELPALRNPNDLPDPDDAEFWVGPRGERFTGPRSAPPPLPPVENGKKHGKKIGGGTAGGEVALSTMANEPTDQPALEETQPKDCVLNTAADEIVVLSEDEEAKLRHAQMKFAKSQTWYRPHSTPTHHAFPISSALWIALCMVGNSIFQIFLCGVMWGLNRFDRPAWTTGCLIPLSFGCGIAAAVLIWRCGESTKRKKEVTRKMWQILKRDEEELQARIKAAQERREAEKKANKANHIHPNKQLSS